MMQCPSCGTANRLGAIFCRSCGAKLEIDGVTSQTFEKVTGVVPKDKKDAKTRAKNIAVNVLRLAFLGLVVLGVYLALQRPEVEQPETSGRLASAFDKMQRDMLITLEHSKQPVTRTTTKQALNSYLGSLVGAAETKGTVRLVDSWVLIEDNNDLNWIIEAKLLGRPLRFQYFGTVAMKDGKITFTPKGFFAARMGKLPYPSPLLKLMASRFWKSVLEGNEEKNKKFLDAISDFKFEGEKITVTLKP